MDESRIRKFTFVINSVILLIVLGLMAFFYVCGASILVYFSIPTIFVYLLGYVILLKNGLNLYVRIVYFWITIYMGLTTLCLGNGFGFCLYSLSMIPIIYYINYMAYSLHLKKMNTATASAAIITCYLVSTLYAEVNGPVYETPYGAAGVFWLINSAIVFSFLIAYTALMVKMTINSEEKLKVLSYTDRLTGLYNRHYIMEMLTPFDKYKADDAVAMIDIDDFKKINDIYGHNAGDYVLRKLADIMRDTCSEFVLSRWGGEEFLIVFEGPADVREKMENLRKDVEKTQFIYEDQKIDVHVTIGFAFKGDVESIDKWIDKADDNLYYGKNNGKNVVIG